MKREKELDYIFPLGRADSARAWTSERMYYTGLGESGDAGMVSVTPSGQATRQADKPWYASLVETAAPALSSIYQQRQMTKMNIARINRGQSPLTASEYANAYQPPSAQVQVGPTAQAQRLVMYGGIALLALVGLRAAKII